ncbi:MULTISPECIES: 23S rRNA (guanosine(2251)-2'-O)-methyltransferase RlmB [Terrabacteria group]|uniref:23S rRNA (guanosine(2251)-2'-O)-methyltransferase RlmB n=1 Tax=Bacillati TaxID=1783272 RepID=UPI0019393E14|nr:MULTISPECIES: 23S rRNA (guanosine(2251)-2'-O)-methyltransferase RlmB [Terrabacteria group]MBW9212449.1 23S rRNA (guanosine(2251)-2'-O)-methyltransferase RlmB [Trueperella sp. zg.1013]QRG86794.1 23S rRNA (guanosine(2251)-2'-O)-methyltransferase RlmB [Bulleidia sp. zg-1006]
MAEWIYGKNVVKQSIEEGRVLKLILQRKDDLLFNLAQKKRIPVEILDRNRMASLVKNNHHQGVIAQIQDYPSYSVDEIVASIPKERKGLLVMLDGIVDPHNLGAILRTCDAVGADGVIFKKDRAVGLNATVAKVSVGAIQTVKCASVTNLSQTIEVLKKKGYWIVGTAMNGSDYRSLQYDFPTVLVIGNEGKGISPLVMKHCDYQIHLPMVGKISSLNASVSAGILLYEIHNKRFPLF